MKIFLVIVCILLAFSVLGQEPVMLSLQGYGGSDDDQVTSYTTKTNDGGFIISLVSFSNSGTGNIDSFCAIGGYRTIFLKYNADASILEWTKCYENSGDSFILYLFPTNDGGFVLGGEFNSAIGEGFLICKEDGLGNIIWSHSYSKGTGALVHDMIATNDGGYIMIGNVFYTDTNFTVHNSGSLNADIAVIKLDSFGNKVWSKAIGGTEDDNGSKVLETAGGYYVIGNTASNDSNCTGNHGAYDLYVVRLDNNGNIVWHNDIGGTGSDGGKSAISNGKGGAIIFGFTNSIDGDVSHPTVYNGGYWLINLDSSNHIIWDNCYGGAYCQPYAVCKAINGNIWLTGTSSHTGKYLDTAYGGNDAWVVHTDSVGNFLNAKVLGSNMNDEGMMIYPLSNGNVISGGFYSGNNGLFTSLGFYGATDIFLTIFSPWTTKVSQISNTENEVRIFPNPASDQVTIEIEKKDSYTLEIYDVIGRLIYKTTIADNQQIAVNEWRKGTYCVHLIAENGCRQVRKLLID